MKRRLFCLLLSAVVVLGAFLPLTPRAQAAEKLKTSEACIALIKEFEGFLEKPVYDYKQYSIGYGSACEKDDYPNGITEAEADQLLREDLAEMEPYLDRFADKFGLNLSQRQYDALMSFTYNLGPGWMNEASTLRSAITEGKKGNDLIFAMTMWCNAGGSISQGLVDRRLSEANLYLNGVYSKNPPANYHYVLFDNNADDAVTEVKIQGYDANQPDELRAFPTRSGYRFLGWYTKPSVGAWVTGVDGKTGDVTLYAHWQAEGASASNGVPASYIRYAVSGQKLYDSPNGQVQKTYSGGEKLSIVGDYLDDEGTKWGRLSTGGWVNLTKTEAGDLPAEEETVNLELTVTGDDVNIRKGPGTSYEKVGTAHKGDKLTVTRVQQGGVYLWGQFSKGWICLDYTDYEQVIAEQEEKPEDDPVIDGPIKAIGSGVVINCKTLSIRKDYADDGEKVGRLNAGDQVDFYALAQTQSSRWGLTDRGWVNLKYIRMDVYAPNGCVSATSLNVRSGPGTGYERIGSMKKNELVLILETKTVGTAKWGRIGRGWVSLSYIKQIGEAEPETEKVNTVGIVTGTDTLRVRSGPGTGNEQVGTLKKGDKLVIIETQAVGSAVWGRYEKGWVHMDYIELTETKVPDGSVVRTVTGDILRIRAGAGTSYEIVGSYVQGTQVVILEQKTVGNTIWGRTDLGWISMDYVA